MDSMARLQQEELQARAKEQEGNIGFSMLKELTVRRHNAAPRPPPPPPPPSPSHETWLTRQIANVDIHSCSFHDATGGRHRPHDFDCQRRLLRE